MSGNWLKMSFMKIVVMLVVISVMTFNFVPLEATTIIDEIVVTATRMEEKGFDVPTPIEVVSAETLTINSPATAAQSLAELPGVSISSAGFCGTRYRRSMVSWEPAGTLNWPMVCTTGLSSAVIFMTVRIIPPRVKKRTQDTLFSICVAV